MSIKQIAVFLENRQGRLSELTETLGKAGVDLVALSIADTGEFGILRMVTRDNDHAVRVLRDAGYVVQVNSLIGVEVTDSAGGLSQMLKALSGAGVDVDYLYSFAHTKRGTAVILFRVADEPRALAALQANNIKTLKEII